MRNFKGFAEVTLLLYVLGAVLLFFVPNPVSSSLGIGVRPNKTTYSEKIVPVRVNGQEVAFKTITSETDSQQHVGFFEWLRSLPVLVLVLMFLGVVFPAVSIFLHHLYQGIKYDTKKIVVGVDKALAKVTDPVVKKQIYDEIEKAQDQSTKELVDKIQGKK